jgi:putative ABC transport system permease protein
MVQKFISLIPFWILIFLGYFFLKRQQKNLAKEILWATFRTTIQLIALAFALELIFTSTLFILSLFVSLIMTLNSSLHSFKRSKYKDKSIFLNSFFSNVIAIWPIAFVFSLEQNFSEWTSPKVLLPLMGMLLGNSLNGVNIGLESFMTSTKEKKDEILSLLALGASNEEALKNVFFRSVSQGMRPHINSMLSMGVVSIPGMMTGQLLSNTSAFDASIVQVKMMIAICLGTFIAIYISLKLMQKKIFKSTGELCIE